MDEHIGLTSVEKRYPEKLKCFFNKAIKDEISASIMYAKAANELEGLGSSEVSEELLAHSKEEFEHFNELLSFASKHGFMSEIDICLDDEVVKFQPLNDAKTVMKKVQELEEAAISDYSRMAKCAMRHGDIETAKFMKELMGDEIKHFDDLAFVNGDKRKIGLTYLETGV